MSALGNSFSLKNENIFKIIAFLFGICKYIMYICYVINNKKKHKTMKATVSYSESGKIQVFTTKKLKGRGIKNMGLKSNGETRYLLTQNAYDKIQHLCEWIG